MKLVTKLAGRARAMQRGLRRRGRTSRAGMTVVEVLIALVILGGALTGMSTFIARHTRAVTDSTVRLTASDLAADRLEDVKAASQYSAIDAFAVTESSIAGFPRYSRRTLVTRVGGAPADLEDYKVVTVIVTAPGLAQTVRQTTIISQF